MQSRIWLKLIILGGFSIVLLATLASIGGITRERKNRQEEARQGIAESYAGRQQIIGPVFEVSYREFWQSRLFNEEKETWYEKETSKLHTTMFFPDSIQYNGSLQVQERYRGIFKAHAFQSAGHIEGVVKFPAEQNFRTEVASRIEVVSVTACLLISDPRGISNIPSFVWMGDAVEIVPGSGLKNQQNGIHAVVPVVGAMFGQKFDFGLDLNVHGMGQIQFVPIGFENRIRLESKWPHPSFTGDFLATNRAVSDAGFTAEWMVNSLACSAQQDLNSDRFRQIQSVGVSLIDPVNPYALTGRALKYGFLFVFITFAFFFLFELIKQLKIHPIQYGFVGLAQAIFFLLLLSLSEHIGFGLSYLAASVATIGVITIYLCSVLQGVKRGLLFGGVLAVLYGALYGLLQSEDHALVAGSVLLFGLLTLVMMLTRKLDWYALGAKEDGGAG